MACLTILHTSDLHNRLTPEAARWLHDLKAAHPGSTMLDSGDAIWAGNVFWRPGGEPILDLMNSVPYDAMCMGNREFHFLSAGANSKTSRAAFPILSANLRAATDAGEAPPSPSPGGEGRGEGEKPRLPTVPYITFNRAGIRITVFGLSVPCITERMLVKRVSDFYFEQPITVAQQLVPKLRAECDLLIALTHVGLNVDREIAERAPGIDLILGGHTHTVTENREVVGGTLIAHHGFFAHHVGKVDVEVGDGHIGIVNELIPIPEA